MATATLIGREAARSQLERAVVGAAAGRGRLVLVAGPAGIGKTALIDDVLADAPLATVRAAASVGGSQAWGPVVAALRAARRRFPESTEVPSALAPHLALLLPESGEPAA